MSSQRAHLHALIWGGVLLTPLACFNDYGKFEASSGGAEAGRTASGAGGGSGAAPARGGGAGEAPSGGTSVTGGAGAIAGSGPGGVGGPTGGVGTSGGTGGTGGITCDLSQKLCGETCIPNDDPQTGCAEAGCDPCASAPVANGVVGCITGRCAITSCDPGRYDCNDTVADGCEHDVSTFDATHCGGCGNSCVVGNSCVAGVCTCTAPAQCGDRGTYDCTAAGRCSCTGVECNPGEVCRKSGANEICGCNGAAACEPGQVCCRDPAGCFDLQTDPQNCGACGWPCPDGQSCVAGVCTAA